jgi:hypothetical protein
MSIAAAARRGHLPAWLAGEEKWFGIASHRIPEKLVAGRLQVSRIQIAVATYLLGCIFLFRILGIGFLAVVSFRRSGSQSLAILAFVHIWLLCWAGIWRDGAQ